MLINSRLKRKCQSAIKKGLRFLSRSQLPGGSFCSIFAVAKKGSVPYSLESRRGTNPSCVIELDRFSLFPSALIGSSLIYADTYPKAHKILDRIACYIEDNKGRFGIWQHFTKGHRLYEFHPYDVDDTAIASSFLRQTGRQAPRNERVILMNRNREGLIYTWLAFRREISLHPVYLYYSLCELRHPIKSFYFWRSVEAEREDVDAVVNANVLTYLGLRKETKKILSYVLGIIENGKEGNCDKWYLNISTVHYFFSKAISSLPPDGLDQYREIISHKALDSFNAVGSIQLNPLDTALDICTLLNLGLHTRVPIEAIRYLVSSQHQSGAWDKRAFYFGGRLKRAAWGSEELTTAICIEALSRYVSQVGTTAKRYGDLDSDILRHHSREAQHNEE